MSNERYIMRYKALTDLIWAILIDVNVTQAERVGRVRKNVFELGIGSDQDYFEFINWYAVKAIQSCAKYSMISSRRGHFDNLRFWNHCIVEISQVLGSSCTYDCHCFHAKELGISAHELWCQYPKFFKALRLKVSASDL